MLYVGLDVHNELCQACVIDESGRTLSNERFSSTNEELNRFLNRFPDAKFVLESTGIWEFIYEGIGKRGFEVVLAHPLKGRAIAEARVKTDKVDAETLAQLLRTNLPPTTVGIRSWMFISSIRAWTFSRQFRHDVTVGMLRECIQSMLFCENGVLRFSGRWTPRPRISACILFLNLDACGTRYARCLTSCPRSRISLDGTHDLGMKRLSTPRRVPGGRDVRAKLLPYPRFLAMLQYVLERRYEFKLDVGVSETGSHAG